MAHPAPAGRRVQVGEFHLDLESGDLDGHGTRVRLQVQSLELLRALLERPGAMVGRDELRQRLWPDDTFVDFDHGLNAAVRRLREALGDSADTPRYVETIPRKGYRLIAPTDSVTRPAAAPGRAALEPASQPEPSRSRHLGLWSLGAVALATVGVATWSWAVRAPTRPPPMATFTIDVPDGWLMQHYDVPAISPDSRFIAFTATPPLGPREGGTLWVHPLDGTVARQVAGVNFAISPFWSPDSSTIGFFNDGMLMTVPRGGGPAQRLAPASLSGGGAWLYNGDIVFTPTLGRAVHRHVPGSETSQPITTLNRGRNEGAHLWPFAVPGTDRFVFLVQRGAGPEIRGATSAVGEEPRDLGPTDSRIVATSSGHVLWVRDGTLLAQRLDPSRTALSGIPTALAQDVSVRVPMLGHFAANADLLVYLTRAAVAANERLTVFDRTGAVITSVGELGDYSGPRVSPDGTRVAVCRRDTITGTRDIWVYDLLGTPPLRLTFDRHDEMAPVWSRDGQTIYYSSDRRGERDIYRKDATGQRPETLVHASDESKSLNGVSGDGRLLVYDTGARGSIDSQGHINRADVGVVSLERPVRTWPLAATTASESMADIAPDGSLVTYQSSEVGGRPEVFVETFPDKGGRWQVTIAGGTDPVWRADGRELFFISPQREMCAIDVRRDAGGVRFGAPRVLFSVPNLQPLIRRYAPFPDGQRFLAIIRAERSRPQQMTVVVNWRSALPE